MKFASHPRIENFEFKHTFLVNENFYDIFLGRTDAV
jgi:hypothetical protein